MPHLFDVVEDPELRAILLLQVGGASQETIARAHRELNRSADHRYQWLSDTAINVAAIRGSSQLVDEVQTRRLDDVRLAAIVMDGTPIGGQAMVWAMGITMDGQKVPLGFAEGDSESEEVVLGLLRRLEVDQGLDMRDVLFVSDGGKGQLKAIDTWSRGRAAIQRCRVHRLGNVTMKIPKAKYGEMGKELGRRMRYTWGRFGAADAAHHMAGIKRWLEGQGLASAGSSVPVESDDLTFTLQLLHINTPRIRKVVDNSNTIENAHSVLSRSRKRVKKWQPANSGQRRRVMVTAIAVAELNWSRALDRDAWEQVSLAVVRGRHFSGERWAALGGDGAVDITALPSAPGDERAPYSALWDLARWADRQDKTLRLNQAVLEQAGLDGTPGSWLDRCGFETSAGGTCVRAPRAAGTMDWAKISETVFEASKRPVPTQDEAAMRAAVAAAVGDAGELVSHGDARALDLLGLAPGGRVQGEELLRVAQGRRADDGRVVRRGGRVNTPSGAGKLQAVQSMSWELTAPEELVRRWQEATGERRAEIERAFLASGDAGLRAYAKGAEMAVVLALERDATETRGGKLRVRGLVVGFRGDKGNLVSPFPGDKSHEAGLRRANNAATQLLEAELARMGPQRAVERAPEPSLEEPWPVALDALDERSRAWVRERVPGVERFLSDQDTAWIRAQASGIADPFAPYDPAVSGQWQHEHGPGAVDLVAAQRVLARRARLAERAGRMAALLDGQRPVIGGRRVEELIELGWRSLPALTKLSDAELADRHAEITNRFPRPDQKCAPLTVKVERMRDERDAGRDVSEMLETAERRLELWEGAKRAQNPDYQSLPEWMDKEKTDAAEAIAIRAVLLDRGYDQAAARHSGPAAEAARAPEAQTDVGY